MLRESTGDNTLAAPLTGEDEDYRVPLAAELIAYAEAVVGGDDNQIAAARGALLDASGAAEVVDAAGIIADFEVLNRIADATGADLDERFRLE